MLKGKMAIGFVLLVLLTGTALAQSSSKMGVGIAILDLQKLFELFSSDGVGSNTTITVPLITSPTFRIEPELGYFSYTTEYTEQDITTESTGSAWNIGAGLFLQKVYNEFTLYYGGRIGYLSQKTLTEETDQPDDEETTSGLYLSPAIGGEHNFSGHFSIGAEAQIVYASLTNEEDGRPFDVDVTLFNTRALVFFRFYF
jgi:hypothetical protein